MMIPQKPYHEFLLGHLVIIFEFLIIIPFQKVEEIIHRPLFSFQVLHCYYVNQSLHRWQHLIHHDFIQCSPVLFNPIIIQNSQWLFRYLPFYEISLIGMATPMCGLN